MKRTELFTACALAAVLLSCADVSRADPGCITGTFNADKLVHVVGIAGVVAVGTEVTGNEYMALGAGVALSAARELYKWKTPGYHCSAISIGADIVGLGVGHYAVKRLHLGVDRDPMGKPRVTARFDVPLGAPGY